MPTTSRSLAATLTTTLALTACGGPVAPNEGPAPVIQETEGPRALGTFVLRVDPAKGTVTQIATSRRGVHTRTDVVQDGDPLDNPPDTFQVVTTSARLPGDNCAPTDNCFEVRVDSFLARPADQLVIVINQVTPTRVMRDSSAAPAGSGLSSPFGMRTFGDVAAGGSSGLEEMNFVIPNLDPYVVEMTLWELRPPGATVSVASYDTGWYHPGHDPANDSYFTGRSGGLSLYSFFLFDLSSVSVPVNTVVLSGPQGACAGSTGGIFRLYDVVSDLDDVQAGGDPRPLISDDLHNGVVFGSQSYNERLSGAFQSPCPVAFNVTLNSAGRQAVRDALGDRVGFGGDYANAGPTGAILMFTGNGIGTAVTLTINP